MSGEIKPQTTGKFRLEALEPRVLLSGDTPFAEVYRTLLSDEKDVSNADADAYIQQLDAETSAVIAAANGSDFDNSSSLPSVNVDWSEGWQVGVSTDESDAVALTAETENGTEIALLEQATTSSVSVENTQAEDDALSADSSDQDILINDIPGAELPRGPPVNEQFSSVVIAAESIQINDLSLSYSSETDEREAFDVEFLLISEVSEDGLPRAPPVADVLSYQKLAPVLEEAIRLWTAAGLSYELAGRLAGIQVYITDLANGELGQAQQNTITLDTTATGRGWFVDPTPGDNAEFSLALSDFQMAAVAGSLAYGRIDLLTVLVHEIGHVLGFDHEAGLAVMGEHLNHSQRVLLDGDAVALTADLDEPVSDALVSVPTLNLSAPANNDAIITIQVNLDGTLTINGTQTGDNLSSLAGIDNIVGNASATITLAGPDKNVTWTLGAGNTGSMVIAGGPIINFTDIDKIRGGSGDDRLVITSGTTSVVEFNGQGGFDAVVNEADKATGTTFLSVENFIDRPLLFIPGFGGAFIDTTLPEDVGGNDALTQWYLTRGIDPTKLVLEPLANSYSDFVQTLVNTGYTDGTNQAVVDGTLYVSLWDWRVPVAITADGSENGVLTDVTASSIVDWVEDSFDSALDYFAYWMDQAAQAWEDLTGAAATSVDLITHSTGGLVARSYLQSQAYLDDEGYNLLPVYNLVQTGVPNQGSGAVFGMLNDDFGLKSASRGLGLMLNDAYDIVMADTGASISNPDGSVIDYAALSAMTREQFIAAYVETLTDLLAVYNFLDGDALDAASGGNALLLDLNGGAGGQTGFFNDVDHNTYVVYSAAVDTPDLAVSHTGIVPTLGAQNEILPFSNVIGQLPGASEVWYQFTNPTSSGDGTVSAFSASDGFAGLQNTDLSNVLFEITATNAGSAVAHTGITHNSYSQSQLLRLLGIDGYQFANISTELLLNAKESALNLIAMGLVDPIELARQAFADTKNLVADIETRLTAVFAKDLPVIGMSLNELIALTGFDLFGQINAALAPVASALSEVGTVESRLAQLEELLEDAFGLADVGPPTYDNPEIELIYDDVAVSLTMVFDFDLTDVTPLPVNEFGLELGLGLAFSVTLDIGDLISVASGGSGDAGTRLSLDLTTSVGLDSDKVDFAGVATVGIVLSDLYSGDVPDITLSGDMTLDVDGSVLAAGAFSLSQTTPMVDLFGSGAVAVDLLRLDLTSVDLFVGVGGAFDTSDLGNYEVVTTNAAGFFVDDANLYLAIANLADASADSRIWTGLVASASSLGPVGLPPGYTVTVNNLLVLSNSASGKDAANVGASRIDWSVIYSSPLEPLNALTDTTVFSVDGDLILNMNGYVMVAGGFSVTKTTPTVDLPGEAGAVLTVMRIDLTGVDLFVGVGGVFDTTDPDNYEVDVSNATGFLVDDADLSIALASLKTPGTGDNRRWTGFAASASGLGPEGLPDNFDIRVDNLQALANSASGSKVSSGPLPDRLNWSAIYIDALDPLNALTGATVFSVAGDVTLNLGGYVMVAGGLSVSRTTQTDVDLMDDGELVDLDLLRINLTGVDLFVGVGGVFDTDTEGDYGVVATDDVATGFLVSNANLNLAIASVTDPTPLDAATDTRRWTGIAADVDGLTAVGLPENFELHVDNLHVLLNSASGDDGTTPTPVDAEQIDWAVIYTDTADPLNALEAGTDLSVSGDITINLGGYVLVAGGFLVEKTTQTGVNLMGDGVLVDLDLLRIDLIGVDLFVGVGGVFDTDTEGDYGVVATDDVATGFLVSNANLNLAIVSVTDPTPLDAATDTRRWTGIAASASLLTPVGLPAGFVFNVADVEVLFNSASGNDGGGTPVDAEKIDWAAIYTDDSDPLYALEATTDISVSGYLTVQIASFVLIRGGFAFTQSSGVDMMLAGDTAPTEGSLITLGFDKVNVFVGDGPYFIDTDKDGVADTDEITPNPEAIGLLLKDVSIAVALFKPTTGSGSYYAVSAFADDIQLLGLDLGTSDAFKLDASGYRIEVNGGSGGGAINFAASPGGKLVVATGGDPVEFKYATALLRVAIDDARLEIADYIYVSGGFAFTRETGQDVKLSGGGTDKVNVLAFGAGNVDVFVGNGPYFQDGMEERDPDAIGLALENVNFGLLLMKSTNNPATKYTTVIASADRVGLVGLDSMILTAAGVTVEYNSSNHPLNKVIDFSDAPYLLDTGNGVLEIAFDSKVIRASVEDAQLQISDYVFIRGGLAFEKGAPQNFTLTDGAQTMLSTITVGAQNLTMFFGVDGPYWTDLDGDNAISWTDADGNILAQEQAGSDDNVVDVGETAELNPNAVGVAITNVNLAMTLLKSTGPGTISKYLALHATADQIGFVGIDAFQVEGTMVAIDLNLALGAADGAPVVNFADTYPDDEWQALFDLFDADGTGGISVVELNAALGAGHGVTAPLETAQELVELLNAGGAPPDTVLYVDEVVSQLNNLLQALDLEALADQVLALDLDGDGKFDPIGYEVKTGSGYLYLSSDSRQIHASADKVLINIAEFVYVEGSFALDIGSRETVTINTGIPTSLGTLASEAVALVNDTLADLEVALDDLKVQIVDAINDALESLRTEIYALVDDVINNVVDYLEAELAGYVGSLSELTQEQLAAAVTAISDLVSTQLETLVGAMSVDGLIDAMISPIIDPIIDALPGPLQGPVGDLIESLLSPIREKVNAQFGGILNEGLVSAVGRITTSVSEAIDAAIQAAAATGLASINAAIENARDQIVDAIHGVLDPQFDRISLELDKLIEKAEAQFDALFVKLYDLADIEVGDNFSTLENVEVEVTAFGISKASAFVGLPPSGGFDFDQPFAGQIDEAVGLYIDNFNMALGIFKPVLGKQLPTFTALKLHSDAAGFSDGDPDGDTLTLVAKVIDVELNLGGPIVPAAAGIFGNATIDFKASFPDADPNLDGYAIKTSTTGAPVYLDFAGGEIIKASVKYASLQISEFVHISGSFAFEKGAIETVDVTGGLLSGVTGPALDTVLDELDITLPGALTIPATGAMTAELSFMTIGASNVHAFVGIGGPYWTDGVGGTLNNAVESGELHASAKGLWIENFDFGMAIMTPTNKLDFVKYFALKASADEISIVNIEGVEIDAHDLLVEVNQSTPGVYGLPLFPVVDFASSYAVDERQALFDLLRGDDNKFSVAEQALALTSPGATDIKTVDELVKLLDIGGAPPPGGTEPDGMLTVKEVTDRLTSAFSTAHLAAILALDADGDGKFDPKGYEVNTGSTPVYLAMDSSLIRAQGFVELNLFDIVYLTGSVAFELGPTQEVTLSDLSEKTVTTMTIGAGSVTAFIGANGPYWTDLDGNQEVTRDVTDDGNGRIDADESDELNDASVGFEITDLDIGIMVMASIDPDDLGVYLAAKLNVNSFGLVGIDGLTATGSFDVELNVGVGLSEADGFVPSLAVVDFVSSFSEVTALFALVDADHDGTIEEAEQTAAFVQTVDAAEAEGDAALAAAYVAGYTGVDFTTVSQLTAFLNAGAGLPDEYLTMEEVAAKLKDSFETDHQAAMDALDADTNGRLNTGFEVNTGNPAAPVVLDFEEFQISIQLGGEIELKDVFRLYGVFIFEVDLTGLKAFVAAGLEIGPDMEGGDKIFNMNALGALVINGQGVAADLNISVSIGGALSDVIQLNAEARLVFNTTGQDQSVTIPARYVDFLFGEDTIPASAAFDTSLVSGLTLTTTAERSRLTVNSDGSATYTISGTAPIEGASPGFYLLATFNADLTILRTFVIHADFRLLVTGERFDLGFNGTLALGGFGSFGVSGGAVIDANGFAATGTLTVDINLASLVTVNGAATVKINTATSGDPVTVNGVSIAPNTYKVEGNLTVGLFGVVSATGQVSIGLENGIFEIAVNNLNITLFSLLSVDISGYIRSNGQFNLSGSLTLDLTGGGFGIDGSLGLTVSNSGFSGYGSVGIVLFGESFNIASATFSVYTGANPYVYVRAEGPLGVWVSVTIGSDGVPHFDGGLGFLDDIIGAIGEVAEAVAEAIVAAVGDAIAIVGEAFNDLGEAILDLGAAIGDALEGFARDVENFFNDLGAAFAEAFSTSRTILKTYPLVPKYSYSWLQTGGTLTINMNGGTLADVESPLSLAVVGGKLIVDGPNKTESVLVAERQKQTRSWNWGKARWNSWRDSGSPYGAIYENMEFSNMKSFEGVTKVIILGTEDSDTIVMDAASITMATEVYGNGGNDTILTGNGNDYVDGGAGNDIIYAFGGNDTLHGGDGNDVLRGGTGDDNLFGGAGNDVLDESVDRGNDQSILLAETNVLDGGAGADVILGSPGKDSITGGSGDDKMMGLNNEDTYRFSNGYGTDVFADYYGKAYLDFSAVTSDLLISISDDGFTAATGEGNLLSIDGFISIPQYLSAKGVAVYADFQIAQIKTGTGDDTVTVTALPLYQMDIIDAGGTDLYDFDLSAADTAQAVARIDITDNEGANDRIDLDVDSTGFPIYLHPQAVLLNHFNLTFNTGVEILNLTDDAAKTTITTAPGSGFAELLIKSRVTITSSTGGEIELIAREDFIMQLGAVIQTAGAVVIRADNEDVDSTGATINLFGTINANTVTVYGNDDNDTVNITNVVAGAETTINAGAGNDTVNVGSSAPAAGGDIDAIRALLTINGEGGSDVLNVDDSGDTSANVGTLTATTITGLDMGNGSISYGTFETLTIGLGTAGDVFTIQSTHLGATTLNANTGADIVNVRTISGVTNVNGGHGSDDFNVGSNAAGVVGNENNNTGGTVDGIGALLTLNGHDPTSGSDWLTVDDTADTNPNTGTLTSTTITGLDMGGSITYGTIEHLVISLGSGGNTFTISSTHGAATGGFQEDTTVNSGSGVDTVNVNGATDLLVVNGQTGHDIVNVNGTGAASVVTVNAGSGADTVNINNVTYLLTVNGQDDADTINVNATGSASDVTVNAGAGTDTINIYDGVSNLLTVNGDAGDDTIHVFGTGATSELTLNGDADNDTINVRAMDGTVNVNGGVGNDTVNVGSDTPTLPGVPTDWQGTIDDINGVLTVNGGGDSDTLNVDDSDPAVLNKFGELTAVALIGLDLEHNIAYSLMETLNIWLAEGDNSFTISSTHAGSTTLSTALGHDTVDVDGASGTLTINAEAGNDVINVRATGLGSQTFINGQGGDDVVNLSDNSPLLPADTEGNIDAINGLISIDGGAEVDVINVDDSANSTNKAGTLSATTLRGLEMEAGVNYVGAEDFNLWLGTGTDGLYIDSTHAGTTDVFMGDGNATVNQRDDTVAIKSISGITTVHGQGGNDFFYVNVQALSLPDPSANDANFFTNFKAAAVAAANESLFNALFTRTHANGLGALLNLHGDGDSDLYTLNLAGQGDALVNVHDNGAPDNGVDTLIFNGADVVEGLANQPNDTFLLRRDFVALLNDSDANGSFDKVERVNYDENINARLIVNGLRGNDKFVADDNSTVTTLDGGDGNDTFQIGQLFGTLRDAAARVAPGDVFDTTPVIIGVITDPDPSHMVGGVAPVIFDPTSFDPVTDKLSPATVLLINTAIAYQRNQGNLALDGVAYVSQGVSHATTVFGGKGEDTFNVYHNKGTLRLEGEADNDTFTVRAFVTIDLSVQAETEVRGGEGTDTINYAINAPVNIDGGAGFDRVVVLGTPFNDSFVVSSEGIFGAGLNVKFTNVEAAELDTLEGNDTIFILGTSEDIVTTVIGGLGDDTINVMGDVTKPIVSNDLLGRSGVITQGLNSTDADYNLVGVNGVAVNVLSAAGDSLIKITPTGEPLLASEAGLLASYYISLIDPDSLGDFPVYLTVSAGVASSTDRSIGGAGVLVSVNGGVFTNAVVLTFDELSASTVFKIDVKAIDDSAAEGPRMALISHSINSANAELDALALIDIFVNVVDNDQPGLDIRHVSADGSDYGDNNTQVLENGFGDVYTVALTAAPGAGETVTVTLVHDAQVTVSSTVLTFDSDNWSAPQQVTVTAVNDGLDGISISKITHGVTSTGGVYSAFPITATSQLSVTVYDDETPGAIVQQSGGSTIAVEGGATDAYRVRLTQAPESNVTMTLRTDMQTLLSGSVFVSADETGDLGYFEYAYIFNTSNWDDWFEVTVSANPDFDGPDDKIKSFAPQDQNLDQIRGPLIIEGGPGVQRAFAAPVMLPGETNDVSDSLFGDPTSASSLESNDIDILNVFHTDNSDSDTGRLFYRTFDVLNNPIANVGLALTGFEMGGDVSVEQGTSEVPKTVYYGGGITYNGFEIVEVLLGKGNETLTIDDTGDRDEKDVDVNIDHASVTAIHGGGGDDTITINGRGDGPLVIYGDTSEDGLRYSNNQPAASVHGTSFFNPGIDTINASGMPEQDDAFVGVVIYGGAGNDSITGSQDDDHLAGGSGNDTINGGAGHDHIYGDSSFNLNLMLFAQDQMTPFYANQPDDLDKIKAMFSVVVTAVAGGDTLYGDAGDDVIFGDHGVINQVSGTRRIESTGSMILLQTTTLAQGSGDTIHGNHGNDFIFGGVGRDNLYGDLGSDLIFGDHGIVVGEVDADMIGVADGAGVSNDDAKFTYTSDISSAADASADNDTIYGGSLAVLDADTGNNILLGQQGSDTLYGGGGDDDIYGGHNVANGTDGSDFIDGAAGNDVILGDNGLIERTAAASDPRFAVLSGQVIYGSDGQLLPIQTGVNPAAVVVRRIELFDHDNSAANDGNYGNDVIAGGADDDVIFGQLGNDILHGDGMLIQDDKLASLTATIQGSDEGGDDYIEGNGDGDTIYGGLGQDDLVGGSSSLYNLTDPHMRPDGEDTVYGGNGDMIDRNTEGDGSHARDADMILGDNGNIYRFVDTGGADSGSLLSFNYDNYDSTLKIVVRAAELLDYTPGGNYDDRHPVSDIGATDIIHGESGDDFIYGMVGNDVLFGEGQDDDIIGGYGHDWISGGTGQDGILGDDGRIFTSRNSVAEWLYGIAATTQGAISTAGNVQQAELNVTGELKKSVDLTPFNVDPLKDPLFNPTYANDIIFGGLGSDFLHGGSGDDAISGAEALPRYYAAPFNNGNVLGYSAVTGEFAAYNEFDPWRKVTVDTSGHFVTDGSGVNFILNFQIEGPHPSLNGLTDSSVQTDGNDKIFGDLGNDWLVGGTGRDNLYGGWGDDLLNADDDQNTGDGVNKTPDTNWSYEDRAFGGAGRDILIANTGGDRLIDWAGEFNSYVVPFAPFGAATVSRALQPQLAEFLYALSASDGADATRAADTGSAEARNGEPEGELGLVLQKDVAWQNQTGAPADPQPGNVGGSARDVLRAATFTGGNTSNRLALDSGGVLVQGDALSVSTASLDGQVVLLESTPAPSTQVDPAPLVLDAATTGTQVTQRSDADPGSLANLTSPRQPSSLTKSILVKETMPAALKTIVDFTDLRGANGGMVFSQQLKSGIALTSVVQRQGRSG